MARGGRLNLASRNPLAGQILCTVCPVIPDPFWTGGVTTTLMVMTAADPRAGLEVLVRNHQRGVWRYLRYLGAQASEADDLTQETFLEVWRKPFDQYDARATAAYLRQVAKNRFLMLIRARGRRPEVNIEAADQVFAEVAREDGGDGHIAALAECLKRAQGKAKQVVDLFYLDGHSRAETARLMQMNEEGVKTLLRRVKETLRQCVEGKLGSEPDA